MVGRDRELGALNGRLTELLGSGGVLAIEGEAGIGKTSLLDALIAGVSAPVARITAHEDDTHRPFAAARELAAMLGVGPRGDPDRPPADLLLDAAETAGDVLLVIDDAQWLDDASVTAVSRLARRARELPVALLLATRPRPRSAALAALLARSDVTALGPLTHDDSEALLRSLDPTCDPRALAVAAGNPFLLHQLAGRDDLTRSLVDGAGLSDDDRRALATAALLGAAFTVKEWGQVLQRDDNALTPLVEDALSRGILRADGARLAFAHDLWREAFERSMAEPLRAATHRRAAEERLRLGATELDVAEHIVLGAVAPDDEAAGRLRVAARAASKHDLVASARLLEHAAKVAGRGTRVAITLDQVTTLAWSGRPDDAIALAEDLLRAEASDLVLQVRTRQRLAVALAIAGRNLEAADQASLALRTGVCTPAQVASLEGIRAFGPWKTDPAVALERALVAEALAREADATDSLATAFVAQARALDTLGRFEEMFAAAERAQTVAARAMAQSGLPGGWGVWASQILGEAAFLTDRSTLARRSLLAERRRADASGSLELVVDLTTMLIDVLASTGEFEEAAAEVEALRRIDEERPIREGGLTGVPLRIESIEARLFVIAASPGAGPALRRWDANPGMADAERLRVRGWQGKAASMRGDVDAAARAYEEAWLIADAVVVGTSFPAWRQIGTLFDPLDHVRTLVAAGRRSLAHRIAADLSSVALANLASPRWAATAALATAEVEHSIGPVAGALDAARQVEPLTHRRWLLEGALALLTRLGRPDLDAGLAGEVTSLAGAAGARSASGSAALSPAELRVVRLVADGLTNAEVADQLYLSRYTVETHLKRVFKKVGVRNRAELTAAVVAGGLPDIR